MCVCVSTYIDTFYFLVIITSINDRQKPNRAKTKEKKKKTHTSSRCVCLKVAMIQCVVDGLVVAVRAELELVPLLVGRLMSQQPVSPQQLQVISLVRADIALEDVRAVDDLMAAQDTQTDRHEVTLGAVLQFCAVVLVKFSVLYEMTFTFCPERTHRTEEFEW